MSTYDDLDDILPRTLGRSATINTLDDKVAAAFALLPDETKLKLGTVNFAVDTGIADAYLVALPHDPGSYVDGLKVRMRPLYTNTGAATVNVNSLGVKSIKLANSSNPAAGDINAGAAVELIYSSSTGFFHIAPNSSVAAAAAVVSAAAALVSQNAASASASAASLSEAAAAVSETNAETAETNAETAQTAAELAETNAETAQTAAELAETNAETAETNAGVSAAAAAADLVLTNADVVLTHADVVLTHADVVLTNADAAATAADVLTTNADVVLTNADAAATAADVLTTNADVVLTNADAASTAADVITTNADVVSTNADAASTAIDAAATAADVVTTNADVVTTNADVVTTNADAASTAADAASIATIYDNFDDRYLGAKASDPTVDNDGDALLTGALYFNTVSNTMRAYNGAAWGDVNASISDTAYGAGWNGATTTAPSKNAVYDKMETKADKGANSDITSLAGLTTPLTVAQGGQGSATLADGGLLVGAAAGPVEVVAPGATTEILVGGGAGTNPVWTTVTGTGAPVKATSPTLVTPLLGTPTSGTLTNCTGLPTGGVTMAATAKILGRATAGAGVAEEIAVTGSGSVVLATSPALVTPALGTPASGDLTNCTAVQIVTDLTPQLYADLDGQGNYAVDLQNFPDMLSGGPGYWFDGVNDYVSVADDANLDPLDQDMSFLIAFNNQGDDGALNGLYSRWTAAGEEGLYAYIATAGFASMRFKDGLGGEVNGMTTTDVGADGKNHVAVWTMDRSANMITYLNGNQESSNDITGQSGVIAVSEAGIIGSTKPLGDSLDGTINRVIQFNLALTAAEVKAFSNGAAIPYKYIGASQTNEITGDSSTFTSGAGNWSVAGIGTFTAVSGKGRYTQTADSIGFILNQAFSTGKKYRLTFKCQLVSGTATAIRIRGDLYYYSNFTGSEYFTPTGSEVTYTFEFVYTTASRNLYFEISGDDGVIYDFDDISMVQIGCVLDLNPSGITASTWYDQSGNGLNGTVSGAVAFNKLPVASNGDRTAILNNGQIAFPATAVPSSDPNTLDDYEEGTWDVTFVPQTSGTITLNASYDTGWYQKVGNTVAIGGYFVISSVSSPTGELFIATLPFVTNTTLPNAGALVATAHGFAAGTDWVMTRVIENSTNIIVQGWTNAGGDRVAIASLIEANSELQIGGSYITD